VSAPRVQLKLLRGAAVRLLIMRVDRSCVWTAVSWRLSRPGQTQLNRLPPGIRAPASMA
jgi:hypothetical protein